MAGQASTSETLTRDDAQAWLRQFPFPGWTALGFQALMVLAGNGLVLWLLASGRLPAAGLILLVVLEFALLMLLAQLAALLVPRAHWFEPPKSWREQLFLLGFLVVWGGGAYSITLLVIQGWGDLLAYFRDASRWHATGLSWALGVTMVLALCTALGDWLRYRANGPPFISALGLDVMSRLLTVIFGAIPFAMPVFVVFFGGLKLSEWVIATAKQGSWLAVLGPLGGLGISAAVFALVGWLIDAGVDGWAIGFVLAKCLSELMVVAIPIVMREAAAGR